MLGLSLAEAGVEGCPPKNPDDAMVRPPDYVERYAQEEHKR